MTYKTMNEDQQTDNSQNSDAALEKLQSDFENAMNNWKRTAADFENYKKRKEAENKELIEFAREVTVAKLLPTLDALEQALRHLPEYRSILLRQGYGGQVGVSEDQKPESDGDFERKYSNWQSGVNGIVMQLEKVLGELGVKKIEALGKKFDPHLHEAVKEVESEADDGIIVDELQTGFELNGKIIRPSQVTISKRKL
jgi:molecular chaperone GrpE